MKPLRRAIDQHLSRLKSQAAWDARYVRSGDETLDSIDVVTMQENRFIADAGGEPFSSKVFDLLIGADELILNGVKTDPQLGDEIHDKESRRKYVVVKNQDGRCFEAMDTMGAMLRVFGEFKGELPGE